MANNAFHSKGSKLEIKGSGSTYTKINGFKSASGIGGGSPSVMDASDLDSVAKEKLMGLPDEGQASFTFNFLPDDAGQVAYRAARGTGDLTTLRVTVKNKTYTVTGYVLTAEWSVGVDEIVPMSSTFEISGVVVEGTIAP